MQSISPLFPVVRGRCTVLLQVNRRNILGQAPAISEASLLYVSDEKCEVTTEGESSSLPGPWHPGCNEVVVDSHDGNLLGNGRELVAEASHTEK
jgi:hypothetical protein